MAPHLASASATPRTSSRPTFGGQPGVDENTRKAGLRFILQAISEAGDEPTKIDIHLWTASFGVTLGALKPFIYRQSGILKIYPDKNGLSGSFLVGRGDRAGEISDDPEEGDMPADAPGDDWDDPEALGEEEQFADEDGGDPTAFGDGEDGGGSAEEEEEEEVNGGGLSKLLPVKRLRPTFGRPSDGGGDDSQDEAAPAATEPGTTIVPEARAVILELPGGHRVEASGVGFWKSRHMMEWEQDLGVFIREVGLSPQHRSYRSVLAAWREVYNFYDWVDKRNKAGRVPTWAQLRSDDYTGKRPFGRARTLEIVEAATHIHELTGDETFADWTTTLSSWAEFRPEPDGALKEVIASECEMWKKSAASRDALRLIQVRRPHPGELFEDCPIFELDEATGEDLEDPAFDEVPAGKRHRSGGQSLGELGSVFSLLRPMTTEDDEDEEQANSEEPADGGESMDEREAQAE